MASKDDLAINAEKALKNLLAASKQQGRRLKAEREYAVEAVGVGGTHRTFQEIAKTVSEGDENVATGYQRQMIVSIKSIEAENLPGNVFRDGVKQILDDIMKIVNDDVLLSPEMKGSVQDVANQLIRYADRRGKVGARAAATAAGLAKRVRSSVADTLSGKRSILLRGLGYLLKSPDRKAARAQTIADARLSATEGALGNREQGEYDPQLMRSAASRIRGGADAVGNTPTSPEGVVLVDIRTGINALVDAEKIRENEYQSDREDASLKDEEGQDLFKSFSPSKMKENDDTKSKLIGGTQSLIGKLMNLIPGMSTAMKMLPMLSSIATMVTEALGIFFASALFATLFAGIIATAVVGAAWFALLSKWGELFGLKKEYKAEGNRNLAVNEIAQLKSEGTDMSFADTATTTGEMARAVANTRLSQGSITEDELSRLKKRGVEPPKSGEGFTDENAIAYLEVRKEIANEKLTGKTGALGGLQANMIVALGGASQYKTPSASSRSQNNLPPINTQENASMRSGFVEGGTTGEGAVESLPEGRSISTSPLRVKKPSREVENAIRYAAETTDVDYDKLLDMAFVESGYNPNAVNTKSKAIGLFQFVPNTWKGMIKNYGEQYPLLTSGPTDPFANALAGALLYKENTKSIGSDTLDDAYLAHFAGAPVAKKLLRAPQQSAAASFFTEQGRLQNKEILFNDPKTMTKPRTVEEVRNLFAERLSANRQGQTLAQASTALDQQKTATITNNIVSNRNAAPPPAQTQSTYIPYAVSPRDDSRQAINHVNAT
jgi:hypothetical protein